MSTTAPEPAPGTTPPADPTPPATPPPAPAATPPPAPPPAPSPAPTGQPDPISRIVDEVRASSERTVTGIREAFPHLANPPAPAATPAATRRRTVGEWWHGIPKGGKP